jgi:hypothetical protein
MEQSIDIRAARLASCAILCHLMSMIRKLPVTIERETWPTSGFPSFPAAFHRGRHTVDLDVCSMLLLVGHLTTPTLSSGVSLSEFWAWVRYFYAVANTTDLRITSEFANLDSHQKMILSDDFGMGVPMSWLITPLQIIAWCDGREFADRFSALTAAPTPAPKKRGPTKSPDFVCLDRSGKFHVIECKGTQSGTAARSHQLSHVTSNGTPSGGVVQKRMIVLQRAYQGQRLACGLAIGREGTSDPSDLQIVDPDGDDPLTVGEEDIPLALDPILRGSVARALRSSGLRFSADVIVAPSGQGSDAKPFVGSRLRRFERVRQGVVTERRERARTELAERGRMRSFNYQERTYTGRQVRLDLPRPLMLDGNTYGSINIRQGVRRDFLTRLAGDALEDRPIMECAPWFRDELTGVKLIGDGGAARLVVGNLFFSELRLRR